MREGGRVIASSVGRAIFSDHALTSSLLRPLGPWQKCKSAAGPERPTNNGAALDGRGTGWPARHVNHAELVRAYGAAGLSRARLRPTSERQAGVPPAAGRTGGTGTRLPLSHLVTAPMDRFGRCQGPARLVYMRSPPATATWVPANIASGAATTTTAPASRSTPRTRNNGPMTRHDSFLRIDSLTTRLHDAARPANHNFGG
jgi:hypothetical protein